MKESIYKNYDELPLFLNAATVAKVLGIAPSGSYELMLSLIHILDVPVTQDRRNVPSGFGSQHPQENSERRRTGTPKISRLATYIRDLGTPEWRGRKNGIEYARSLRRGLHAANLYPRHAADAGKRSRKDGQFYGAGHVKTKRAAERMT